MPLESYAMEPAAVHWEGDVPVSDRFGDGYYSRAGGPAESRYVFLTPNDLPLRWSQPRRFRIGETGFGSGLNFLVTLRCWKDSAPRDAHLEYLAVERYPMEPSQLARLSHHWPELDEGMRELLAQYPPPLAGCHRLEFAGGRVRLTLVYGEAAEALAQVRGTVDAWFLDGFAPSRNPDMWCGALFQQLARLSREGTTFATYTAAARVRAGLEEAGFRVAKRAGFAGKRHMLAGSLAAHGQPFTTAPWYAPPPAAQEQRLAVIGAGLAGATVADALARRGWEVTVYDAQPRAAAEASGNRSGVLAPALSADMGPPARLSLQAFIAAVSYWRRWIAASPQWGSLDGVVQLCEPQWIRSLLQRGFPVQFVRAVTRAQGSCLAGVPVTGSGLFFPRGGWLATSELTRALLGQPRVSTVFGSQVTQLRFRGGVWHLEGQGRALGQYPNVVIANGAAARCLAVTDELPVSAARGQVTHLAAAAVRAPVRMPLCGDGYLVPDCEGREVSVGATFDRNCTSTRVTQEDHHRNLARLSRMLGVEVPSEAVTGGRAAVRCVMPDHLPVAGPVPEWLFYDSAYGDLSHGRPATGYPAARYQPGLYVTTGHGARGLAWCPMAAQLIADSLEGAPLALPESLAELVHPARFLVRRLRRGCRT